MSCECAPIVVAVPGDLHLTEADRPNWRVARHAIDEINEVLQPDFVQFIGDNVQNATSEQFRLFLDLAHRLTMPWFALVGDHDIENDPSAERHRAYVGEPNGSFRRGGFRFVRLNTQEARPVGMSPSQCTWLDGELADAQRHSESVVLFQHNYPYKVYETFDGPGIAGWRRLLNRQPVTAIVTGHTHYGQIANDGRNVAIAVRSIGDPEGGQPGYLVLYVAGNDLAITYRTVDSQGPIVLITHPRDWMLAIDPAHVVHGNDQIRVRTWSAEPVERVEARIDELPRISLERTGPGCWIGPLPGDRLAKGDHQLHVFALARDGRVGTQSIPFIVDPTGRYTATPMVRPMVRQTSFC